MIKVEYLLIYSGFQGQAVLLIMKTLVTGANGFVGSALCEYLEGKKIAVQRVVRRNVGAVVKPGDHVVETIDATTDWATVLDNVDVVVHLAARVHVMNDHASDPLHEFREVNTRGTANLARQAANSGVKRFVYLSTIKVSGEKTGPEDAKNGIGFCEADLYDISDDYALSKWEAEQALLQISDKSGLEIVIIRPPLVYGPGVKANFLRLMKLLDKGVPLPLGSINNRRSMVYLGNLVDFILECINEPAAAGETFLVADGEDASTPELLKRLAEHMGCPERLLPVPEALLRFGGMMFGKSAEIDRLCGSLMIDISKAKSVLNWNPPFSLDEGLRQTVKWFMSQKSL